MTEHIAFPAHGTARAEIFAELDSMAAGDTLSIS